MYKRLIAFFLLIVLCLTSCAPSGAQESNPQEPDTTTAPIELFQPENAKIIDAFAIDAGFGLLVRRDADLVLLSFDNALNPLSERVISEGTALAGCTDGESVYSAQWDGIYREDTLLYPVEQPQKIKQMVYHEGTVYSVKSNCLLANDREITLPHPDELTYGLSGLVTLDGALYAIMYGAKQEENSELLLQDGQKTWLCPVNAETKELRPEDGTEIPLTGSIYSACDYWGKAYLLVGSELYCYDGEAVELLCNLASQGVGISTITRTVMLSNEQLLVVQQDGVLSVSVNGVEKPVLTMGTIYGIVDDTVTAFNRSGAPFSIEVREFEDIEKLNLAILNGEIDLVASDNNAVMQNYAAKGILLPYEEDILTRILPNVVQAAAYQGTCYYLPIAVSCLASCISTPAVAGVDMSSMEALIGAIEADASYSLKNITRRDCLMKVLAVYLGAWIDWQDRTASFDSESFVQMLELCKQCMLSRDEIQRNKTSPEGTNWLRINDYFQLEDYINYPLGDSLFGEPPTEVFLFPVDDYAGKCILNNTTLYAAVNGGHEDSAKAFLSYLFADDTYMDTLFQRDYLYRRDKFSVNQSQFEQQFQTEAQYFLEQFQEREQQVQQSLEEYREMLLSATRFSESNEREPANLILEEAATYFNDDCTAREAAERIQERVSIYLAEQN